MLLGLPQRVQSQFERVYFISMDPTSIGAPRFCRLQKTPISTVRTHAEHTSWYVGMCLRPHGASRIIPHIVLFVEPKVYLRDWYLSNKEVLTLQNIETKCSKMANYCQKEEVE
jgi:hypothetical protein